MRLPEDVQQFLWITVKRMTDTVLLQVIQNAETMDLGSYNKYRPLAIVLAEMLRRNLLGGIVAKSGKADNEQMKDALVQLLHLFEESKTPTEHP